MSLVAVRFQAWITGDTSTCYAEISSNHVYPPFHLRKELAFWSIYHDWRESYVTWKSMVLESEAQKALKGEVTWILVFSDNTPEVEEIISQHGRLYVIAGTHSDGVYEFQLERYLAEDAYQPEEIEVKDADFLDWHILQVSSEPFLTDDMDVAVYDSNGTLILVSLIDCYSETGFPVTISSSNLEPKYYIELDDWHEYLDVGNGDDRGDLDFDSWSMKLLGLIGQRVLEIDREQRQMEMLIEIMLRCYQRSE